MICVALLIYIGICIGAPVWYYIGCGIMLVYQGVQLGIKIGKRRVRLEEIKTTPSREEGQ